MLRHSGARRDASWIIAHAPTTARRPFDRAMPGPRATRRATCSSNGAACSRLDRRDLLAAAMISDHALWTLDLRLDARARALRLAHGAPA
jgi:hypothetical protein